MEPANESKLAGSIIHHVHSDTCACIYCIERDFGKVFRFGKYGKDLQIKNSPI